MDIELERSINHKLSRQNEINLFVKSLIQESRQSLVHHQNFKQLIGYKDLKKSRRFSSTTLNTMIPSHLEPYTVPMKKDLDFEA